MARFVTRDYHRAASETGLLYKVEWQTIEERRRARLTVLFKIKKYNLICMNANQDLTAADSMTRGGQSNFTHIISVELQERQNYLQAQPGPMSRHD